MIKENNTHIPEIVGGGTKYVLQKGGCYRLEDASSLILERKEVSAY